MSKTREIKMLIDRVDETLMVLALAIDDLVIIRDELKKLLESLSGQLPTDMRARRAQFHPIKSYICAIRHKRVLWGPV